ncbi:MAG: TetR family transcriptional regulator [Mycobacteriales bacterium]
MSAPATDRVGRQRGRPPGRANTRQAVLDAARRVFADRGYQQASLRAIAAEAGVDAGMVRHFFGDKAGLFRAAMELPFDPAAVLPVLLGPGLDGLGERVVRFFVTVWEEPAARGPFLALIRSVTGHEESATMFREFITDQVLVRVAAAIDRPNARLRASLTASQLIGMAMIRYVVKIEPLASASVDEVVAAVAPTVQRYLTGDVEPGPAG